MGLAAVLACDGEGPEHHILASLVATMPDFQFLPQRRADPVLETAHANAGQRRAARGLHNGTMNPDGDCPGDWGGASWPNGLRSRPRWH
jgi:hypothetical protein